MAVIVMNSLKMTGMNCAVLLLVWYSRSYDIFESILTIGEQLCRVIRRTNAYAEDYDERAIAIDLLKRWAYLHRKERCLNILMRLSGGMRQRVCIAMAVAGRQNFNLR